MLLKTVKNKFRSSKKLAVVAVFGLGLVFIGGLTSRKAHAQLPPPFDEIVSTLTSLSSVLPDVPGMICEPTKVIYRDIMIDQKQSSIVRTHYFLTAAGPLNLYYNIFGMSLDHLPRCAPVIGNSGGINSGPLTIDGFCTTIGRDNNFEPSVCGMLQLISYNTLPTNEQLASVKRGGLLGMIYNVHYFNRTVDVPVNTAYYFNDRIASVPVLGKALAADPSPGQYEGPFLETILYAWKIMRNLAYALMAVYMFYVGILIMTRKHVDQRTVVTVQYALPKIVLAVFLITFSYAIGAALTNIFWILSHNALGIVRTAFDNAGGGGSFFIDFSIFGFLISVIVIAFLLGLLVPPAGPLILPAIVALIMGIIWAILEIKIIITYLKLVATVVTGPIEILYYSIPGSEKTIAEWFKKIFAYGIGLFSIKAIFWLVAYTAGSVLQGWVQSIGTSVTGGNLDGLVRDGLFLVLGFPMLIIFGLIQAFTVPKKIEGAILGRKGGKR